MATSKAVIFDLDGVLTDTAELHYQSWQRLCDEEGICFDRRVNEALRGLSREESLKVVLGERWADFSQEQRARLAVLKNEYYIESLGGMTPDDMLPGALELLNALRERGVPIAVASSSKNAGIVIEHLGIRHLLDAVVDGNHIERSKPAPEVFLKAAQQLGVAPAECVVIEDAASGVEAALAAGMRVIGIGPAERVGRAHVIVNSVAELDASRLETLAD